MFAVLATQIKRERSRRVSRISGFSIALTASLTLGLLGTMSAQADPVAPPTTSDEAKALWEDKEHEAALAGEELSAAEMAKADADAAVAAAQQAVADAEAAAATADQAADDATDASVAAAQDAAEYQVAMDAFASASFQGGSPTSMSALITSDSAEDMLDKMSVLDQVAADSKLTMDLALVAQDAAAAADAEAAAAAAAATQAAADAEAAKATADQAAVDAATAQQSAESRKSEMDAAVAEYETLYNELSEQERAAAAAEAERQRAESAALQAAANAASAAAGAPVAAAPVAGAPAAPAGDAAAPLAAAAAPAPVVSGGSSAGQAAVAAALSKVGSSYVFGASGPSSFDCSGLTSWAWNQAGVGIPRTSRGQAGLTSVPLDQLQPGDLVTYYSPVSHVGMYIGNGQIVHASTPRTGVTITTVAKGGPNPTGHRVG